ncbi:MAG: tryptophan--tRNA ligase [Bacteriovoracaceae bacterium]|jgi:tryptophanyl-tRNA synthetase|nr:tryptophan--tRNA ligase [Bacteriovoracaceae bacterium]
MKDKSKTCLTGIKPTGMPHLGNYLGAIKPAIEMANSEDFESSYFIADYHSLTTIYDPTKLNEYIYEVAAVWLAMGLDPNKSTLYKQSDIPEVMEMNWILSCFTSKGLMNRAHAYKAITQDNLENKRDADQNINMGIYSYPVLMSADILFLETEVVPVGADQLQHIEIARDIANAFNHHYGEVFTVPEALVRKDFAVIPGLDGRKMSKSYDNTIPLFLPEKKLKKLINKITTDSQPPETPKNPNDSLIFDLFKLFAKKQEITDFDEWYKKGIGWGEAKAELFKVINRELEGPREIYNDLMKNRHQIDEVLVQGRDKVRPKAQKFLNEVKLKVGVK